MIRIIDCTHRELTDEDIARIANTYHAWRGEKEAGEYKDVPGFCKSATLEEIRKHGYVLTPFPSVGVAEILPVFQGKCRDIPITIKYTFGA